jgi:glutamate 5-kinase
MSAYGKKFHAVWLHTAWFLVTHADLEDHSSRANEFMRTIEWAWSLGVIPIVNENDPISTEEMREVGRWCDNDQNAFLLARIFRAHLLILITNTNWVYRDIWDSCSRIASIEGSRIDENYIRSLCNGKSLSGTGGMASKLQIGHEAWAIWIDTHIWDGIHSWLHDLFSWGTNILSEKQKWSF